jgi:glycosyltransferase involved in cell wall biosynthesis
VDTGPDSSRANRDITAVITNFNYGRYLSEAVDSVLRQGASAVVVDDGSTEPVPDLPADVELIRQANQGVATARNVGLARVQSPFVIVLDADDRLAPGALEALRRPLDADPQLGFAYGCMRFFGDWAGELRFPPYDPYGLLYRHTIGLTALMRREVAEDTGGFDPAFERFEDWELWVNALAHGWHGYQIDAVTVEYRRHPGSKHTRDRPEYRQAFRQLREKHAELYRHPPTGALGPVRRLWYRVFWGLRPVPARLEGALHRLFWRNRS